MWTTLESRHRHITPIKAKCSIHSLTSLIWSLILKFYSLSSYDNSLRLENMSSIAAAATKVGILSMGDMGAGIGRLLVAHGIPVATNCEGRR